MFIQETLKKNVVTFFDCQNLFGSSKNLWGYTYPNFNPIELSKLVVKKYCDAGSKLNGIRIYTGIHDPKVNYSLYHFWNRKLLSHKANDTRVHAYTTPLRYTGTVAREKGIDIRIALDLVRMARLSEYDVGILFSQDNDFEEVAQEIRAISQEKQKWIKIASAFPVSSLKSNERGVNKTDWFRIEKHEYDSCIDTTDYRLVQ